MWKYIARIRTSNWLRIHPRWHWLIRPIARVPTTDNQEQIFPKGTLESSGIFVTWNETCYSAVCCCNVVFSKKKKTKKDESLDGNTLSDALCIFRIYIKLASWVIIYFTLYTQHHNHIINLECVFLFTLIHEISKIKLLWKPHCFMVIHWINQFFIELENKDEIINLFNKYFSIF